MVGEPLKVARAYLRVSTHEQDLTRQDAIVSTPRQRGITWPASIARRRPARADRSEPLRLTGDLQPGEDQPLAATRGGTPGAINSRRGARLAIPGVVDLRVLQKGL